MCHAVSASHIQYLFHVQVLTHLTKKFMPCFHYSVTESYILSDFFNSFFLLPSLLSLPFSFIIPSFILPPPSFFLAPFYSFFSPTFFHFSVTVPYLPFPTAKPNSLHFMTEML